MIFVYIVFFFSSRRRHTRLQGDWSSDVCSSDLRDDRVNLADISNVGQRVRIEQHEIGELAHLDGAKRIELAGELRRKSRRAHEGVHGRHSDLVDEVAQLIPQTEPRVDQRYADVRPGQDPHTGAMHFLQVAEYALVCARQIQASHQRVHYATTLGHLLPPVLEEIARDVAASRIDLPERVIDYPTRVTRRHEQPLVVVHHRRDDGHV